MLFHPEANHRSAFLERSVNQLDFFFFNSAFDLSQHGESVAKRGGEERQRGGGRSGRLKIEEKNFCRKRKEKTGNKRKQDERKENKKIREMEKG